MQWIVCCFGGKHRPGTRHQCDSVGTGCSAARSTLDAQAPPTSVARPATPSNYSHNGPGGQADLASRALLPLQPPGYDSRVWPGILRDALVLERLAASVTVLSLSGLVLHQNPGSRQLLGNLVISVNSPAAAVASARELAAAGSGLRSLRGRGGGGGAPAGRIWVGAAAAVPGQGPGEYHDSGVSPGAAAPGGDQARDSCCCCCCFSSSDGGGGDALSVIFSLEPDKMDDMLGQLHTEVAVWRGGGLGSV
ncbi:hypothetical protein PLESTM_000340200 [Pleodorina starrii]|nr:hypothetical protein PLESTM_000340200 [Pleodorina starrii]